MSSGFYVSPIGETDLIKITLRFVFNFTAFVELRFRQPENKKRLFIK
ncbi:MAG: hypothetical protein J5680_08105 [Neisseriaceae bacterium]|nr:hypothetical protein [Neisseriaceae bacterium]MBR5675743.1 hypothetical protein [Neisseriaceae bacterium]